MPEETIKVKLPQLAPLEGEIDASDLIFVWQTSSASLKRAEVSQLPFSSGGGGGSTTLLPATIVVDLDFVGYSVVDGNSVISDTRLLAATGYSVRTTQLNNAAFRFNELEYDADLGKVTILGFELQEGELIIIDAPGTSSSSGGGVYQAILDRLAILEAIAAPFLPSAFGARGGMVLWRKPAGEIPAGWQEVVDWRGRLPIGYDPDDVEFNAIGTKTGGSKTHANTLEELAPHVHVYRKANSARPGSGTANNAYEDTNTVVDKNTSSAGGGQPYSIMNPYRTVMFIEYIGI